MPFRSRYRTSGCQRGRGAPSLARMATMDPSLYDLRRLHRAVQHDVTVLTVCGRK